MRNWKTTLCGLISAAAAGIVFLDSGGYFHFPKLAVGLAALCATGALGGLGITAKDYNVTGPPPK